MTAEGPQILCVRFKADPKSYSVFIGDNLNDTPLGFVYKLKNSRWSNSDRPEKIFVSQQAAALALYNRDYSKCIA
jgi:hypothetical protein